MNRLRALLWDRPHLALIGCIPLILLTIALWIKIASFYL